MSKRHPALVGGLLLFLLILAAFIPMQAGLSYFESIPRQNDIPILMYHCVNYVPEGKQGAADLYVSPEKFEEDLKYLSENGYQTVLPRELTSGAKLPEKPVMITFDDGYLDNYSNAFPLLKKYNMKAEISVIVSFAEDPARTAYLNWDQIKEMSDSGLVEIGSHTYDRHGSSKDDMTITDENVYGIKRLPGESREDYKTRIVEDLILSKKLIEEKTGKEAIAFAYPYGYSRAFERSFTEKIFPVTFSTKDGTANIKDGLNNLPRHKSSDSTALSEVLH